jgi:hypothetical protein
MTRRKTEGESSHYAIAASQPAMSNPRGFKDSAAVRAGDAKVEYRVEHRSNSIRY